MEMGKMQKKWQAVRRDKVFPILLLALYCLLSYIFLWVDSEKTPVSKIYDMGIGANVTDYVIQKGTVYKQVFYTPYDMEAIEIMFGTFEETMEQDVEFALYDGDTDEELFRATIQGGEIVDCEPLRIDFQGLKLKEGEKFYFEIWSRVKQEKTLLLLGGGTSSRFVREAWRDDDSLGDGKVFFRLVYRCSSTAFVFWMILTALFLCGYAACAGRALRGCKFFTRAGSYLAAYLAVMFLAWFYFRVMAG